MSIHNVAALKQLVQRIPEGGTIAGNVKSILGGIANQAESLSTLQNKPDPMKSDMANSMAISAAKSQLKATLEQVSPKLNGFISDYRTNLNANQYQVAQLVPDQHAAEIRSIFRGLDAKGKNEFMKTAIDNTDRASVAAIVTVPVVMSGLSSEAQSLYKTAFLDKVAPMDTSFVDELQTVVDSSLKTAHLMAS